MRIPDPIPRLKAEVAAKIVEKLERWAQVWAADLIATDQPRMSDLRNGRLERFSLERLLRFASKLHCDITINIVWTRPDYRQRPAAAPPPCPVCQYRRPRRPRRRRDLDDELE